MSSYQLSGKDAFAVGLTGVQSWTATRSATDSPHSHSGVAGATDVLQGSLDDTFSLTGVGFDPGKFPDGTAFALTLVKSNTPPKMSLVGSALIESLQITIDKENPGNPIAYTISGGAHGGFSKSLTGFQDGGVYSAGSGRNLDVTIDGDSVTEDFGTSGTCIKSCVLNFKRPLSTYRCGGLTYRIAGNLEASITLNLFESNPYLITDTVGRDPTVVVVGCGALGSWSLSKVRWGGSTGPDPNRTTNAATSVSFTGMWLASDTGLITGPDSTNWFDNT